MASNVSVEPQKMLYRMLGNTGLQVSVLSFGFWATFGAKEDLCDQDGIDAAKKIMTLARKGGVNLFDNAETYGNPQGAAETIMGEALSQLRSEDPSLWRRSDILVTTKIFWGGGGVNEKGLSKKHIMEGMRSSLKRLQMDYVDLVFCHRPDPYTPTATVVRAMSSLVRGGQATAWGTSEWSAQQLTEAFYIAKMEGHEPPQFEQPQYNMFHRERFEKEYFPMFQAPYNFGTTTWSPLKSGLITGKYNGVTVADDGSLENIPGGSRMDAKGYKWLQARLKSFIADGSIEKVKRLSEYAKSTFQCTVSQLAIAWTVKNKNVTTVLLGATKVHQLEENLGALKIALQLTDEHMKTIDEILGNKPDGWGGPGGVGPRALETLP